MKTSHIVELIRKTIRNAAKYRSTSAPSILRLDEALLARTTSEDLGEVSVETLLLFPRVLQSIKAPGGKEYKNTIIIAVDSSSRQLDIPQETIIAASVSVTSNCPSLNGDWPPLFGKKIDGLNEPFIYLIPSSNDVEEPDEPFVTMRNPAGMRYRNDYSIYQAMDEARIRLENKSLLALVPRIEELAREKDVVVLIDGPLYLVTGALTQPGIQYEYREAWKMLLNERITAIKKLEDAGAKVYGIVKRIDKARLLSKNPALDRRIKSCIGDIEYTDKLALYHSLYRPTCTRLANNGAKYALGSSILAIHYNGLGIRKVAQYIILPVPRWSPSPYASKYYRVEESIESWRDSGGRWREYLSPAYSILIDSISRGSLVPVSIYHSDKRAKEITAYLKTILSLEAARNNIPISYSSELEVNMIWARIVV